MRFLLGSVIYALGYPAMVQKLARLVK